MTLASSIADHLISFDGPGEPANLLAFPTGDAGSSELDLARQQIADLQRELAETKETAAAAGQKQIDELVRAKDEELQAGLDELRSNYEANVEQLTQQLQAQVVQHNKDLAERLIAWFRPVLKTMSTHRCVEDLAAVVETLLNENSQMVVKGPEHLLALIEPHLSHLTAPAWTMAPSDGPEVIITAGDARIETCLEEWLKSVEGEVSVD